MAIIDELIAILGYDIQGEDNLRRFNSGLDNTEKHARGAAKGIGILGVAVGSFVGAMAYQAVASLSSTLTSLPGAVTKTASMFEKLETTLTTIEGSSQKARAALDWVQDFAAKTPYELSEVAESFVRLRAYGLDPMSGLLESIGNASSAMGKGVMSGVEAVADAAQGENERLKEFGIRAKAEGENITYSWQENGKTLTKTVKKDGTEIVKALMEIFGRFDGAMAAQSKTWEGMTSNLADTWTGFLKQIGDSGYYDYIKDRLRGVMESVDAWRKDGTFDRVAKAISDFMVGTLNALTRLGKSIYRIGEWIGSGFKAVGGLIADVLRQLSSGEIDLSNWEALGAAMAALAFWLFPVASLLVAAYLALDDFLTYMDGGKSRIGAFVDALPSIKQAFDDLLPGVRSAVQSMVALFQSGDWTGAGIMAAEAFSRGWSGLQALITPYVDQALNYISSIDWSGLSDQIVAGLAGLPEKIIPAIGAALATAFQSLGNIDTGSLGSNAGAIGTEIGIAIGAALVAGLITQVKAINEIFTGIARGLINLDWSSLGSGLLSALRASAMLINGIFTGIASEIIATIQTWFDIDLTGIGVKIANSLLAGLQSIAPAIRAWFDSLLPAWAQGFVGDLRTNSENAAASDAGDRVGAMVDRPQPEGNGFDKSRNGMEGTLQMLRNMNDNLARMTPENAVDATITDARQDNRQFPVSVNTNITQNIQQAAQAPGAAATATGQAVSGAVSGQATRLQQDPAF